MTASRSESRADDGSSPTAELFHYGPSRTNIGAEALLRSERTCDPIAVLVCHGMGQQVRYETISAVAEAIKEEARKNKLEVKNAVTVQLFEVNGSVLARAEINWNDSAGQQHQVHVYEAYWAPLTEGRVTYWDTIKFLVRAAGNGLKWSKIFRKSTFERWMFGGPKAVPIGRLTFISLVVMLVFLLAQVGAIAFATARVAELAKTLVPTLIQNTSISGWIDLLVQFWHSTIGWIVGLFTPGQAVSHLYQAGRLLLWTLVVAEAYYARYFIIQFVGDVAAYISPYKSSKFDELRHAIQKIAVDTASVIYGFTESEAVPHYSSVVIVGHSLGSVVAYDTLNAMINLDTVCGGNKQVVHRTTKLITFGSPLDKTAFIFRMQAKSDEDWIREQLAASVQPLIVDYEMFRPTSFQWINIWTPLDIISGELNYYDNPALPKNDRRRVTNIVDTAAKVPICAHVNYWRHPLLAETIFQAVAICKLAVSAK